MRACRSWVCHVVRRCGAGVAQVSERAGTTALHVARGWPAKPGSRPHTSTSPAPNDHALARVARWRVRLNAGDCGIPPLMTGGVAAAVYAGKRPHGCGHSTMWLATTRGTNPAYTRVYVWHDGDGNRTPPQPQPGRVSQPRRAPAASLPHGTATCVHDRGRHVDAKHQAAAQAPRPRHRHPQRRASDPGTWAPLTHHSGRVDTADVEKEREAQPGSCRGGTAKCRRRGQDKHDQLAQGGPRRSRHRWRRSSYSVAFFFFRLRAPRYGTALVSWPRRT